MSDLRGRHLLTLGDLSRDELLFLLELAAELKAAKRERSELQRLAGRNVALVFEKDSTRTRAAFEVSAHDEGAHVTYVGPSGSHLGGKETMKDTARVLGRMYDAIGYRGSDEHLHALAEWSGVPVVNALTESSHPTQVLADFLTIREHVAKPLDEVALCYLGDARNNMALSYVEGGTILGMDVRIAAPRSLWPAPANDGVTITEDVAEAVGGCDVLCTDVWVSMGEPAEVWAERIELLRPYQVNAETVALAGNADVKFLHCLPAFHDTGTAVGREIHERFGLDAMEVTDEVFESPASLVWDEAENRVHTIKAVLVALLAS